MEIIVIDDGSFDNTADLVKKYPRVRYRHQFNQGVSSARNLGAEESIGDWLIFLDSDDELLPWALEEFTNFIKKQPEKIVFTGGFLLILGKTKKKILPSQGKDIGQIPGSFTVRRNQFLQLGGYDSRLNFAENTELFFRIQLAGHSPALVPSPLMCYYQYPSGGNNNLKNVSDSILWILEKHQELLPNQIRRLYHQILGVNFIRFRQFAEARKHLVLAYSLDMKKLDTLGRLFISCLPPLAKQLYSENPRL
ncbi:Glycosyltransferase involved in cell wall bisynthesis [Algoriphagus alkaliphilus]|uniref:Glycosyltransferase involved in cell wall bisynthesis n=1 Tax=Algoriphagus alkaliphilus TaxID=279824 RepID=A0A1G5ZP49_9BACT|nr:Glycosyltransferase involved in cell wall bisynthesis [Algoriphagus alkaliphilus]